ncbi:T9SS type A sorting domain-containing protein [bacterium]|nr:T9SS type A sorting domain-containing protein [bacterium]
MKTNSHIFIVLILIFCFSAIVYSQPTIDSVKIAPGYINSPLFGTYELLSGVEGESRYLFRVEGVTVDSGIIPTAFYASFDSNYTSLGRAPVEFTGVALDTDGYFNGGAHIGDTWTMLKYYFPGFPIDSGAVLFHFKPDYDFDDDAYSHWNGFWAAKSSAGEMIYAEVSLSSRTLSGAQYTGGDYRGCGSPNTPIHGGTWYSFLFEWNLEDGFQWAYLNGVPGSWSNPYIGIAGTVDTMYIGTNIWGGIHNAHSIFDEFYIFRRAPDNYEIEAFSNPVIPGARVVLNDSFFDIGEEVEFCVQPIDTAGIAGAWICSGPVTITDPAFSEIEPYSRVFAPGTGSIEFTVTSTEPCNCRTDTIDVPYSGMAFSMTGDGATTHTYTFFTAEDIPYTYHVRCAPTAGEPYPLVRSATYRVLRDYDPDFPRLISMWAWNEDSLVAGTMARYSTIILGYVFDPEEVHAARELNPNLKVIVSRDLTYGDIVGGIASYFWEEASDPASPHYNCLMCDPSGPLLIDFWDHPMFNFYDERCRRYIADNICEYWYNNLAVIDGLYFDRVQNGISYLWDASVNLDMDRDGFPDDRDYIDSTWIAGLQWTLAYLRDKIPDAVLMANDAHWENYGDYLNGRCFEMTLNGVMNGWQDYGAFVSEYRGWNDAHYGDWIMPFVCSQGPDWLRSTYGTNPWATCSPETLEWVRTRYDRMRFGLASALMGEGMHTYDFGTTWWGHTWWYDEYEYNLGRPTGEPYQVSGAVTPIDFENFESGFGDYLIPAWCYCADRTNHPDSAITGYSIVAHTLLLPIEWHEFLHSDTLNLVFESGSTYTIRFKYRIIQQSVSGYFYFFLRTLRCDDGWGAHDIAGINMNPATGTTDSIEMVFTIDTCEVYYFVAGFRWDGAIAIDDISVEKGTRPWRRDFTNGIAISNPSGMPVILNLGDTFYAIPGVQDPAVNDGLPHDVVTIGAFDGRIFLNEPWVGMPENVLKPTNFTINAYPNPFNSSIRISVRTDNDLSTKAKSKIEIFDILGRKVHSDQLSANFRHNKEGEQGGTALLSHQPTTHLSYVWKPEKSLGSGIYFVMVSAGDRLVSKKILLLK